MLSVTSLEQTGSVFGEFFVEVPLRFAGKTQDLFEPLALYANPAFRG